ncbi:MAG: SH3 domain-containing protein [Thermodesulfovibrionales bacterium]
MRRFSFLTLFLMLAAGICSADTLSVVTKENAIRESCRFFAPVKVRVVYGDKLEVTGREGDWVRVRFKSASGCIHSAAVTGRTLKLTGSEGQTGTSATSDEVALAGKGFNPQVEAEYRRNHPELDFQKVNAVQSYRLSDEQVKSFIRNGGLREP